MSYKAARSDNGGDRARRIQHDDVGFQVGSFCDDRRRVTIRHRADNWATSHDALEFIDAIRTNANPGRS